MNLAEFFTGEELEQVHGASLLVLEEVGILVRNEKARRIFAGAGAGVDGTTNLVKIPRRVVEECRRCFPPSFTFRGRDPLYDRTIPADGPLMVTASSAPDIVDRQTGEVRRATARDLGQIARMVQELPGFDVFSISTLVADAPEGHLSLVRFYEALKNTTKPVRSNTPNMKELKEVLALGEIAAGGAEAYLKRPLLNHHYCPVVSPLTMDVESTEAVIYLAERGLPVYGTICPNGGMSSPLSPLATLVQGNAEFLALGTLMQLVKNGTPLIYAVLATIADLRSGNYAPGAVETAILQVAFSQMARYYRVPSGGYIGLTNSQENDVQSGYETGIGTTAALLGGCDLLNMGGLLGSLMVFDFTKLVIDHEIALMLKQLKKGVSFLPEDIGLKEIGQVGPGGSFLDHEDTLRRMRTTAFIPRVATREMRERWEAAGRIGADKRARQEAERILAREVRERLDKETDRRIKERFDFLSCFS